MSTKKKLTAAEDHRAMKKRLMKRAAVHAGYEAEKANEKTAKSKKAA